MSRIAELIDLFTKLAFHLEHTSSPNAFREEEEASSYKLAISSLNQTLNFNQETTSRIRVLETALSLMCFKTPIIYDSTIQYLVETIITFLSSSISCKVSVSPIEHGSILQVGSSIASVDCPKLIETCVDVIEKLQGHGMLSFKLLHTVLRVATSVSSCPSMFLSSTIRHERLNYKRNTILPKLQSLLEKETSTNTYQTPLRLLLWYLDPLALKHDISRVLSEVVERPFLCLKKEFHGRMAWHSIIICLVTSPSMFIETRALLHSWFLATGVASILELCIEIIFSVLDALARPMWWGMSLELGLKLPFSHAYFPSKHHELLARLTGPISCESFLDLVQLMTWPDAQTESLMSTVRPSYGIFRETAAEVTMVDHKSMWGMLMHFPAWFYFAAMLLFCAEELDPFQLKCTRGAVKTGGEYGLKLHYAASRYLAWILSPVNECHYDMLLNFITEISSSWTLKRKGASQSPSCSSSQNNDMVGRSKKLKKSKNDDNNKRENIVLGIDPWLKDFQGCYIKYYNRTETIHVGCELPNLLFRRIPLGILVGCSRYLDEKGYDLLLHYASTGKIHGSRGTHYTGTKHAKPRSTGYDSDDLNRGSEEIDGRKDIIAGTSLVFGLFDVIEDMSASMFDSEEDRWEFVSLGKGKAGKYLVNCIKKLLELQSYEDEGTKVMLKDLSRRLTRWSQLGEETFEGHKAFNDAVNDLNFRISSTMKRV